MDGALSGVVPSYPLTEGCLLWLEDRYPRASLADRRGLVCELYTECPTLCEENRNCTDVVPPEGVRRELRVRAGQWGWHASTSYAGSAAGDCPEAQDPMDQEEGPGSAGAAAEGCRGRAGGCWRSCCGLWHAQALFTSPTPVTSGMFSSNLGPWPTHIPHISHDTPPAR